MATWGEFARQAPDVAGYGARRLDARVAYLATIRADGGPRVHPVTPILSAENLFLFMEPDSPKGRDLLRDSRYALHCAVEDSSGGQGEFYVRGTAIKIDDSVLREQAVAASSYTPHDRYILFVLSVHFAFMNVYNQGKSVSRRWQEV